VACLDRFAQGAPDVQDIPAAAFCNCCGEEIYPGEDVYYCQGTGEVVHLDCLVEYTVNHIDPMVVCIDDIC